MKEQRLILLVEDNDDDVELTLRAPALETFHVDSWWRQRRTPANFFGAVDDFTDIVALAHDRDFLAVAHGVEHPATRLARSKPARAG